jgi:hypothetical protein
MRKLSEKCENPNVVERIMKRTMRESQELLRTYYVVDLIRALNQKGVGLQSVENQAQRLCTKLPKRRETLVKTIMTWKLKDAHRELRKQKWTNMEVWRGAKPVLTEKGILKEYINLWRKEKGSLKSELNEKRKTKVKFLISKYGKKVNIPDVYEGIKISDQEIPDTFTSEPRCYGGCTIDNNERSILTLPPKFAMYPKLDAAAIETQIEKSLAKYRWDQAKEEQNQEIRKKNDTGSGDESGKGNVDMRKLKATDLPFNKRVCLPNPLNERKEIELQHLKSKMLTTAESYIERNKDVQMSNLTKQEKKGLRSIRKRCADKDIVVYQTDKSGRFSVDKTENYTKACETHIKDDEVISEQEYKILESKMNAHSVFWTRILQAGKDVGQMERVKNNMLITETPISPLYCLRKDHKIITDPEVGPPMRPVCGATVSYNGRLSHLMSMLLRDVWMKEEDVCLSTEELLAGIQSVNSKYLTDEIVVGSADVKALYPSLDIDFTVEKVCEVFYHSDTTVNGIDVDELGLYLSLNYEEQYLRDKGILEYCPTRKTNRGRHPVITGCAMKEKKEERFYRWKCASNKPDDQTTRKMLVEAMKTALLFIMKNHVYTFNEVIYRQVKGGPIGLELTGVLAQVFMVWWDRQFKNEANDIGLRIHMYKRYVDDINIVMSVPDGVPTSNEARNDDERCMDAVKSIADGIHTSIKVEVDYPSKHDDKKIPILDLKVWTERREGSSVVLHEFYTKEISSKAVIHPRSAMPYRTKRTIMTQEVLRVLLNCNSLLPWEETVVHLNGMVARMQYTGYDQQFRFEVVKSALKAYRKILEMDREGLRPLYRPKGWRREERDERKKEKRVNWYRKGIYSSVMFIPATPNSALKGLMEKDIKESGLKIKVVEKVDQNVKGVIQRSNPFKKKRCEREDCLVCATGGSGSCETLNITYEIVCKSCGKKYIGETARNAYSRGREHLRNCDSRNDERSVLKTHCNESHGGTLQDFTMNVVDTCKGDSMIRQIAESVRIRREGKNAMNTKREWNVVQIPRTRVEL